MIEVSWLDKDNNIIQWEFPVTWTWNDFYTAKKEVDRMIESVEGIVDSVFLTSKRNKFPPGALTHMRNIMVQRHERHDAIILVGSNGVLKALLKIVVPFVPSVSHQLKYASTKFEAITLIEQVRQKRAS